MLSNIKFLDKEKDKNAVDTIGITYSFMNWGPIHDTIVVTEDDDLNSIFGDVENINQLSYCNIKSYIEKTRQVSVVRSCPIISNPQWTSNYILSADISHACLFLGKDSNAIDTKRWNRVNNGEDLYLKFNDFSVSNFYPIFETDYPIFIYGKYAGDYGNKFRVSVVSWKENMYNTEVFGQKLEYYLTAPLKFGEYLIVVTTVDKILEYFVVSFNAGSENHIFKAEAEYIGFEIDESYVHPTYAQYVAGSLAYIKTIIEIPLVDGYCVYDNSVKVDDVFSPVYSLLSGLEITEAYMIFFDILSQEELNLAKSLSALKGKMVIADFHPALTKYYSDYPNVFTGLYTLADFANITDDITMFYGYKTERLNGEFIKSGLIGDIAGSFVNRLGGKSAVELSAVSIRSNELSIYDLSNEDLTQMQLLNMNYIVRKAQVLYIEGNRLLSGKELNTKYLSIQFVALANQYVYLQFEGENLNDRQAERKVSDMKKDILKYFADVSSDLKLNINIDDLNYKLALRFEVTLNDYIDVFNIVVIR